MSESPVPHARTARPPTPATAIRPGEKPTGLVRLWKAFVNSLRGFAGAYHNEAAFRQELALALVVIPAGIYFGRDGVERVLLIGPMLIILIVELLNSAIETAIDRIGTEYHALSGLSKDIGSAAVFVAFVLLAVVWALILIR